MSETTFIYTLNDPRSGQVRYVGKANDPRRRLTRHLRNRYGARGRKDRWLAGLRSAGLRPILDVIEPCDEADWPDRERFWIAFYRERLGDELLNEREGGEGYGVPPIREGG